MRPTQRYVSEELTHFAGRQLRKCDGEADCEAQYGLLVRIIESGRLLFRPSEPTAEPKVEAVTNLSFSKRDMYKVDAVCFCDIPLEDLPLHMKKYSQFGIAFPKSFLVKKGATPAFYIAVDSAAEFVVRDESTGAPVLRNGRRGDLFDGLMPDVHALWPDLSAIMPELESSENFQKDVGRKILLLRSLMRGVFAFCVPFDSALDDTHTEQYYMEREWRVLGSIGFALSDVRRVILPEEYSAQFRQRFPDYSGQITFSN